MNLKQRLVKNLVQSKQHRPQKSLVQLWADLQELEIITHQASKANKLYCEEMRKGTELIKKEMEARSHQSAIVPTQHQTEPQPMTTQQMFEASKDPQTWERLMTDLSPQLRTMEVQYFGR
jgi:hypothetical protein